ncbi:MAG TPA: glycosyl hydrolase, partial [Algoriphagus sp.]|nr:glycosyl hydrolase [Algoriphagus sp.]
VGRPFQEYPERLKRTADLELASGLNRFVIHTSVHQPLDDKKPGFSLGPFGQYFGRQESWAGMAKSWMDYLGRSSYLLQQGQNVADILYLYGENTNITWVAREKLPEIPKGYEFDFVNATALQEAIQAENGKLKAKSGNTYEVLMLDESAILMTLPVLKKIQILADSGVKIIGTRPVKSPSLGDSNAEFQALADQIWAKENVGPDVKITVPADVQITGTSHKIPYRHRKTGSEDIYWLNNRNVEPTTASVSFRVAGKKPMLWNPIDGSVREVSYEIKDGRTTVPLKFESWDAFFIIFRENAAQSSYTLPEKKESTAVEIKGNWKVDFGSKTADFTKLSSWSEHTDPEIKYFSGTASYTTSFNLSQKADQSVYMLDLGEVKNMAEIILNGQNLGIVWKTPFRIDISKALKSGENQLEIRVVNTWVNRLVGDAQPGAQKTTFTTMPFYRADSPLVPSGLLGPVKVLRVD